MAYQLYQKRKRQSEKGNLQNIKQVLKPKAYQIMMCENKEDKEKTL